MYGARLVALVKKDGGLRPIACGEILRRLTAKVLAGDKVTKELAKSLKAMGQCGVGVPAGADGVVNCMRRLSAAFLEAMEKDGGTCKIDMKNAFNLADREKFLEAVAKYAPDPRPYARAAYGAHSDLVFGKETLQSECGVQQGDPLGPLIFCILLHHVLLKVAEREEIKASEGTLEGNLWARAFYLDDGVVMGKWGDLEKWLKAFEEEGEKVGMVLNRQKSEVVSVPGAVVPEAFQEMKQVSMEDWDLLGVPLGTDKSVTAAVDKQLAKAKQMALAIASIPHSQVALTLLRYCAGFPKVVFLMRATGALGNFGKVDTFTKQALSQILGAEIDEWEWLQASLPLRKGGLGLHSCLDVAAVAGIAAATSADMSGLYEKSLEPMLHHRHDPVYKASVECSQLAQYPGILPYARDDTQGGPLSQKTLTNMISEARHIRLLTQSDRRGLARLQSCSAKHASSWIYGHPDATSDLWLSNAEFCVLLRTRLGMPIAAQSKVCNMCNKRTADIFGDHSLSCMTGGLRNRLHNTLRDQLGNLVREALLSPAIEDMPFSSEKHKRDRLDIVYSHMGRTKLLDIAVTHPLREGNISSATEEPGGAAAKYGQDVKINTYGPAVNLEPQDTSRAMQLIPMVVDTFGAWCPNALISGLMEQLHFREKLLWPCHRGWHECCYFREMPKSVTRKQSFFPFFPFYRFHSLQTSGRSKIRHYRIKTNF